jgi:hypothetical protein
VSWLIVILGGLFVARPAFACSSQKFEIRQGDTSQLLDVVTLRETRPEIYVLLKRAEIQELYHTETIADAVSRMARATLGTMDTDESQTQQQKAVRFIFYGASEAFERFKFACGGIVDGLAGELSLQFSKQESERLQEILADPVHVRFLEYMFKNRTHDRIPAELELHIDKVLLGDFADDLVATCKAYGVSSVHCDRLPKALMENRPRK